MIGRETESRGYVLSGKQGLSTVRPLFRARGRELAGRGRRSAEARYVRELASLTVLAAYQEAIGKIGRRQGRRCRGGNCWLGGSRVNRFVNDLGHRCVAHLFARKASHKRRRKLGCDVTSTLKSSHRRKRLATKK